MSAPVWRHTRHAGLCIPASLWVGGSGVGNCGCAGCRGSAPGSRAALAAAMAGEGGGVWQGRARGRALKTAMAPPPRARAVPRPAV
jgi:hypothetical protein